MIKSIKYIVLSLAVVFAADLSAQNLAGVEFSTNVGEADATLACAKEIGTTNGARFPRFFPTSSCGQAKACNNTTFGCGFCGYDAFGFKNIINLTACIEVATNAGACGFNIHGQAYDEPFVNPNGGGFCTDNVFLADQGGSGTATWGWEQAGCDDFYIVYGSVGAGGPCNYSFTISPDPVLDLRCATDPAACIEKVTIGGTPVPTMTQWGLFLFGLIVLTLGVVTIYNMSTSRAAERR